MQTLFSDKYKRFMFQVNNKQFCGVCEAFFFDRVKKKKKKIESGLEFLFWEIINILDFYIKWAWISVLREYKKILDFL